jgi:hypothetical protein
MAEIISSLDNLYINNIVEIFRNQGIYKLRNYSRGNFRLNDP